MQISRATSNGRDPSGLESNTCSLTGRGTSCSGDYGDTASGKLKPDSTTKKPPSAATRPQNSSQQASATIALPSAAEVLGVVETGALRALGLVGALLSLSGDTPQVNIYYHYGFAGDAKYFSSGFRAGGFLTNVNTYTGTDARSFLSLNKTPDAYYTVRVPVSDLLHGPFTVTSHYGQPGGGTEWITTVPTAPGSVTGPYPLRH